MIVTAVVVGAASAIAGMVDTVLVKPLPYTHPSELALVWSQRQNQNDVELSYREAELIGTAWPGRVAAFQARSEPVALGGHMVIADGYLVSPEFFHLLGVTPAWGRALAPADTDRPIAVVTTGLCQSLFASKQCVGKTVRTMGAEQQIAGVLPVGFSFGGQAMDVPSPVQVWVASSFPAGRASPGDHDISLLLRIPSRTGLEGANAALGELSSSDDGQYHLYAVSLSDAWLGSVRPVLVAAVVAALVLLLLAGANLSLLLLLWAGRRSRDLAVRAALGASRFRLVVDLAHEIFQWALLGCGGGLVFGWILLRWLRGRLPAGLPRAWEIGLDARVAAGAVAAAALIGLIAIIGPVGSAWRATRGSIGLRMPLHELDPHTPAGGRLLAGAQLALAIALVGIAAAMVHTVRGLDTGNLGFDASHVVSVEFMLPQGAQARQLLSRFRDEILRLPGVAAAAVATHPPMIGDYYGDGVQLPGRAAQLTEYELAGPGYFLALGVPILAGRGISTDDTLSAPMVAVVNQEFVKAYLGGRDAVGTEAKVGLPPGKWRTIVGVAGDFRDRTAGRVPEPEIFVPMAQSAGHVDTVLIRSAGRPDRILALLAPRLRQLAAATPSQASTNTLALQFTTRMQTFLAWLFGLFGAFALLVAILGLVALTSEAARRGRRALAIRASLGASRAQVCGVMLHWFAAVAIASAIAGFLLTSAAVVAFRSLLFNLFPLNGWLLGTAGLVLVLAGVAGCLLPALWAAQMDPAAELRAD